MNWCDSTWGPSAGCHYLCSIVLLLIYTKKPACLSVCFPFWEFNLLSPVRLHPPPSSPINIYHIYEVYCILGTGTLCHESVAPRPRKLSHIWKLVFWRCFIDKFKISMKKCLLWFLKLSSKISIKWCPVISLRVRHMFTNKKIRKKIYFFLLLENQ